MGFLSAIYVTDHTITTEHFTVPFYVEMKFLKHMVIFLVNILITLKVVSSPWIILQDLSPKFKIFFLVIMVVCLSII